MVLRIGISRALLATKIFRQPFILELWICEPSSAQLSSQPRKDEREERVGAKERGVNEVKEERGEKKEEK